MTFRSAADERELVPATHKLKAGDINSFFEWVPPTRRTPPPLATDHLLANTDPGGSEHHISVLSGRQPATFYIIPPPLLSLSLALLDAGLEWFPLFLPYIYIAHWHTLAHTGTHTIVVSYG